MNYYDLTNPQKSIWLMDKYYEGTNINNICGTLTIKQDVDLGVLSKALNIFIKNNKSFSLNFKEENGNAVQYFVEEQKDLEFEVFHLKDYKEAQKLAKKTSEYVFNIYDEKLYKIILYKLENGHGGFVVLTHHIISDAATFSLMGTEVVEIYGKLLAGEEISSKDYSYEDYIKDEKEYMNSTKFQKDEEYWNNLYNDVPEVCSVPSMLSNKSKDLVGKAERKNCLINKDLVNKISDFCKKNKVSNFNFFMAVYAIYLSKITSLNDFVIGTPILNRTNFKEKHTTGMFINTAPLRIKLGDNISFLEFVKQIATSSLSMLRYQKYPYELLLENLRKKEKNLPTLFDVMLSYQITKANDKELAIPYEVEWFPTSTISNGIAIHLHDNNDEGTLNISYDYQLEKYEEKDILNMHNRILHIISQVLENECLLEKDIEIVTEEEKNQILYEFNDTEIDYPKNKTIIDLFEEQVQKTPNNIAVVLDDKKLTYKELNEKANAVALDLIYYGIQPKDTIGVFLPRSIELIISIFAILKCGAVYMPLYVDFPDDRIDYMLQNSKAKLVLTNDTLKTRISDISTILLNDFREIDNVKHFYKKTGSTNDIIYIIYTSGSTGRPKGVQITNNCLNNFICAFDKYFSNVSVKDNFLSSTNISFDVSIFELFLPLLNGASLVLYHDELIKDILDFCDYIVDKKITGLYIPPNILDDVYSILKDKKDININKLLVGVEGIRKTTLDKYFLLNPDMIIINGYGPTETTICSTALRYTKDLKIDSDIIPIGGPLYNDHVYILNEDKNILPIGADGELYVTGNGVGHGYINNEEETSKNYLSNIFDSSSKKMYKTGDIGKWNPDGTISLSGRKDNQVKISGHRIELGEINSIVMSYPNIEKSITMVLDLAGKKRLVTYFTSSQKADIQNILEFLSKKLVPYMIPDKLIELEEFPLTSNGKIDKKSLPTPIFESTSEYVKPKNETEKLLLKIFKSVLNLEKIGVTDSFFELGGDSLLAIKLTIYIYEKTKVRISMQKLFENPTVSKLANLIQSHKNIIDNLDKIPKAIKKDYYHLSSGQKRIYYASQIAGSSSTLYNMPGSIIFDKKPNIERLNECFEKLIERHSSLRTYFEIINEEVYQKLSSSIQFKVEELSDSNDSIDDIMKEFVRPFDLSKAPLFRASIIKQNDKYLLLFDMHHIICDGTSLSIFTTELSRLYNNETLDNISFDYIDYSEWEFDELKNNHLKESKEFWINQFKNDIPVLDFPTDYVRPNIQSFEGAKVYKKVDANLSNEINNLARNFDVSPYMLLLSAYYILLHKYTNAEDIVVGTPTIGRSKKELLNIIGMFVNTLPLRNHINSEMNFRDFLNNIKTNCIKAFDNGIYPFDELINNLNIPRDTSRQPLFDTSFIYQNNGFTPVSFEKIQSTMYIPDSKISKFDFSLEVVPQDNGELALNFEYSTKLFKESTIEKFAEHFVNILKNIVKDSDVSIKNISILSEEEKHKILYEFNNTKLNYPKDKTISQLFEEQAKKTPDNIAIVFENQKLTYRELNEKANRLAWHLRKIGLNRNDIVSIMVNRSLELLVSILGVLKSGACYIPIDPNYPKDRTEYMLANSSSKLLLTSASLESTIDFENKVIVDLTDNYFVDNNNNLPNINEPDDTSYIIYTSGSTGMPKGVVLKHQSLTNLAYFLNNYVCFLNDDKYISMASVTTASFDIFIFETLIALQKGLKVVIANEDEQRLPSSLDHFIKSNDIKAIQMTPSRMKIFVDNLDSCPSLSNLDYVVLAGEPLPDSLLKELLNLGIKKVYNGYGPSETTVFSSFTDVTDYDVINIGRPLANTQMYILDKNLSPVPIGMPGELYIAGDGVGKGYLNNEKITSERFIPNPFNKGTLMYKTGDACKFLDNGELSYIERLDNQVKLRGLRIELGEIESKLLEIPSIKKVKVVKQSVKNRDFLSAYYVGDEYLSPKDIRKYISASLPDYMIPSYFTLLDDFPYTPNGKIDKNALPLPNALLEVNTSSYIAPRNSTEIALVKILESLFNVSHISISDNFYSLGGDSLTTIALCAKIKQTLGVEVSFRDVMQNPTVEDLATIIKSASTTDIKSSSIEKCTKQDFYPTSSAQKRTFLASHMEENSTLYNIYGGLLLDSMPDISKLQNALDTIVLRHESLRTYFEIINGQIVQKIKNNLKVKIDIQDVNTNNPNDLFYIYTSSFDLSKAPLFNVVLFKLPNGKILLMLDVHHIIFDGTSLNNFIQELSNIYNGEELQELDISYKDFAVWENSKIQSNGFENSKDFWCKQFSDSIPVLNLPEILPRPERKSYEGKTYKLSLSVELTKRINDFASKYNVTPYMVMLSAYYILLNKYTDDKDIIVGTPISGRFYKELEPLIGMFVNSLPIRNTINPNMKFEEFLKNVKDTCIDAFAHQDYPFDMLVNDLKISKIPNRSLLFDTMFIYQNNAIRSVNFGEIKSEYISPITNTSKFDISLEVLPLEDKLNLSFEYCTKLFDEIFIGNFAKSYENILRFILNSPETRISNIPMSETEIKSNSLYKVNKIENSSTSKVFSNFTNFNDYDNINSENYIADTSTYTLNEVNQNPQVNASYIIPKSTVETQVASAFEKLLSVPNIGIDDNFFELGGDSLTAINLQIELLKSNFKITYADIFSSPTIRTLSEKIGTNQASKVTSSNSNNYKEFDKILENATCLPDKISFKEIGNIIITGTTGFLGAHILENFLINEKGKAYCLVRDSKSLSAVDRLKEKLHYYFGEQYDKYLGNRIIAISSDISKDNLGMSANELEETFADVSCIINSAAKVSHYGNYSDFEKINVNGTENLLKLCLKFNKRFYQISTLSVSGNTVVEQSFENDVIFNESNFYINQSLNNVYAKSKFEAEKLVLSYILKGVDAYILRIGNLMNRYSDR